MIKTILVSLALYIVVTGLSFGVFKLISGFKKETKITSQLDEGKADKKAEIEN